jgi:hypothetical protein
MASHSKNEKKNNVTRCTKTHQRFSTEKQKKKNVGYALRLGLNKILMMMDEAAKKSKSVTPDLAGYYTQWIHLGIGSFSFSDHL